MTAQHAAANFVLAEINEGVPVMLIDVACFFKENAMKNAIKLMRQLTKDGFIVIDEANSNSYRRWYKGV